MSCTYLQSSISVFDSLLQLLQHRVTPCRALLQGLLMLQKFPGFLEGPHMLTSAQTPMPEAPY